MWGWSSGALPTDYPIHMNGYPKVHFRHPHPEVICRTAARPVGRVGDSITAPLKTCDRTGAVPAIPPEENA